MCPRILMTIGYQGLNPDDLLEKLKEHDVNLLVDVRQNSNSRKQGFSKSRLSSFLQDNSIQYVHFQTLGTPPSLRHRLKENQDYETFFEEYKAYLMEQEEYLDSLKGLVEEMRCCLMCFEKDHEECHRKIISSTIEEMTEEKVEIIHIR